jgi:SAM-dependent methyltransferase
MRLKIKALLSGLATYVPGYDYKHGTGGTDSARYCYAVWLRHLALANESGRLTGVPRVVAELGPGDSIGIGIAALLSGAEKYFALDVVAYSDLQKNLSIFDELVKLFEARAPIPGPDEFPSMKPELATYAFPDALLPAAKLGAALDPVRVRAIRASVEDVSSPDARIVYRAPWTDPATLEQGSIDMIFSQAVLEHVDDLTGVYDAMRRWLKPGGLMTHQIDYRCHGKADTWNGHWTYSDAAWKLVVGRRAYLLNRQPHSEQVRMLRAGGFSVVRETVFPLPSELTRRQLAPRFRALTNEDLTTSGAFIVATPS